jgi:hypothetical protein
MKDSITNPLKASILARLGSHATTKLTDLMMDCESLLSKSLLTESLASDPELRLFETNFLLMNALFQLQADLLDEGFYLDVDIMDLRLVPVSQIGEVLPGRSKQGELARYYLDWQNLQSITAAEVETLLSSFWQGYLAGDKRGWALETLGLGNESSLTEIRQTYQRLVAGAHPDRGGSASRVIEIREAWEILSR